MKAVSLRQPWAWAVLEGGLHFLPRARRVGYRGDLVIHASQSDDQHGWFTLLNFGVEIPRRLPHGGYVGIVRLVGCITRQAAWRGHDARYITSNYAWIIEDPRPCELRPCRGYPGLWDVDDQPELALT